MDSADFDKIWGLYRSLYPGHHHLDNKNIRIVWEVALTPYSLDDVVAASMAWARKSKYFPNVAEITANLEQVEDPPEKPEKPKRPYGNTVWMAPYIRNLAENVTDAEADEIHAAGLRTWKEAEAAGVDFREWHREYRQRFPAREE